MAFGQLVDKLLTICVLTLWHTEQKFDTVDTVDTINGAKRRTGRRPGQWWETGPSPRSHAHRHASDGNVYYHYTVHQPGILTCIIPAGLVGFPTTVHALQSMTLAERWMSQLRHRPSTEAYFQLQMRNTFDGSDLVDFLAELAVTHDGTLLRLDATQLRLQSLTTEQFREIFKSLSAPSMKAVHLRLAWDIFWPAYEEAMQADQERNSSAALHRRIRVESLWVEDAISRRVEELKVRADQLEKAGKPQEPFNTWARIEAATQEEQVNASIAAWCNGEVRCRAVAWKSFSVTIDGLEQPEQPAGEVDGVIEGSINNSPVLILSEVKQCLAKKATFAIQALQQAKQMFDELKAADVEALCETGHELYVKLGLPHTKHHKVLLAIGGTDVNDQVKARVARTQDVHLFMPSPPSASGYVHVDL